MGLDRDELAQRIKDATYNLIRDIDDEPAGAVSEQFGDSLADALLSALSPPAAVAPAPYEPKVGDVVRYAGGACGMAGALKVLIAPDKDSTGGSWRAYSLSSDGPTGQPIPTDARWWTYIRPATPAERAAAGLPATPAPEAKRPEWVRIVSTDSPSLKVGDVRRVKEWDRDNFPWVEHEAYPDYGHALIQTKWEPCAAPSPATDAPVDPVREAERAVVEAAEALQAADDAYAELYATVKDDDDAHNEARPRLDNLHAARLNRRFDLTAAVRALRAARPVRP